MTTTPTAPPLAGDPAPATRRPWYRRRAFLTTAGVTVVLLVTVLTDLPTHSSRANDVKVSQEIVSEVATDAAPCNLGMTEALEFYRDVTTGHISAANRAQIPALIRDDLAACSFTNESMVDLGSIDVPGNAAGKALNAVADDVLTWCDPAALATITEITELIEKSPTAKGRAALATDERLLAKDRATVYRSITTLEHKIDSTDLTRIKLVAGP